MGARIKWIKKDLLERPGAPLHRGAQVRSVAPLGPACHPVLEEVLRLLGTTASMRNTKLIRLTDAEGAFNGWSSNPSQGVMFNHLEMYFMLGGDWCCTSRRANDGRLYPIDPPRLKAAAGSGRWM